MVGCFMAAVHTALIQTGQVGCSTITPSNQAEAWSARAPTFITITKVWLQSMSLLTQPH